MNGYNQNTPIPADGEPIQWFHDIFRKDGKPYRKSEAKYIKKIIDQYEKARNESAVEAKIIADARAKREQQEQNGLKLTPVLEVTLPQSEQGGARGGVEVEVESGVTGSGNEVIREKGSEVKSDEF